MGVDLIVCFLCVEAKTEYDGAHIENCCEWVCFDCISLKEREQYEYEDENEDEKRDIEEILNNLTLHINIQINQKSKKKRLLKIIDTIKNIL